MTTSLANRTHRLTLVLPDGSKKTMRIGEDEYISDVAIENGIDLPLSCNTGVCVTCTAKLVEGSIVHDHTFLKPEEEKAGFLLTCRTYVKSDCEIITHQEDNLLDF